MDDIRRQDQRLFVRELLRPGRIFVSFATMVVLLGPLGSFTGWPFGAMWTFSLIGLVGILHAATSYNASIGRRFLHKRYEALWNGVVERLKLFDEVLARMRKDKVADLHEMPKTIRRVGGSLYLALRRADLVSNEVQMTEKGLYSTPPAWSAPANDAQAKELYRIADKNIAEYKAQFAGVMAGVQRTEAQCAVFVTTVDTLRMKMIGHRLSGPGPELSSQDFLEAMQEAKLQLAAIDNALEELDFSTMPKMVATIPPKANPADAFQSTPPPLPEDAVYETRVRPQNEHADSDNENGVPAPPRSPQEF